METRFARVGDAHVAYRVVGDGPTDVLYFLSEYIPVDAFDEEPRLARSMRRLSSIARVVMFNRRGVGLSDAPPGPLTQDQQVEDAVAVADEVGLEQAVVFGANVGAPAAVLFAANHPERTCGLVLVNATARYINTTDYEAGQPREIFEATAEGTTAVEPVEFDFLSLLAPSVANDARFRAWWDQAGNRGASPTRARELWKLLASTDVRDELARVATPTLVVARESFADGARYIADHISGARYVELPGSDLMWWVGDADSILDEVESFITGTGIQFRPTRKLATVLFVDVVGSTERAVALGDRRWRELLATYQELAQRELIRWGGVEVGTAGDGFTATFDMPADAVRCAKQIADSVRALEIDVRAGVHTGEIEIMGDDVAGVGVHIAARVQSAAAAGEVWVSRTVADLVTGSELAFDDRGDHELKGVPGRWALYAVRDD
ncbi:MAG TPA: adenylate/guanylate cyclase domain-containing protein [Actinomycetota bacterium]|nr:adenylate/guanylate cyclase domain-containing protein [Actinomycetota bacterium]